MKLNSPESKKAIQNLQQLWVAIQDARKKVFTFFQSKKNDSRVMMALATVTLILAIYFLIQVFGTLRDLKNKIPQLVNLDSYDTRVLLQNDLTANDVKNMDTLKDLINENVNTEKDITTYTDYLHQLQLPYTYLLQYMYLPSLNIWKDPYTQVVDPSVIGLKFLQKNPYNDITLLQRRSDFFKNVGDNNESNDITDIQIGDIVENASGYFNMPISVSFVANSKRAFLLLVDKLSTTSNRENISLINEFFYYLRQEIKKDKDSEIKALTTEYASITWFAAGSTPDKVIAYNLYNWIFNGKENKLIDRNVIDKTVKSIIACNNQSDEACYYQFREKYKGIPTFGYLISTDLASDPAQNLKNFVLNMPPIFSIKEFTFDKVKSLFADATNAKYQWKITIEVYGKGIKESEIQEIATVLGTACFQDPKPISVENAVSTVTSDLTQLSNLNRIDKAQSDNLRELKNTLEAIQKEYPDLSPYKKTIKLFEVYRMINEAGLCK